MKTLKLNNLIKTTLIGGFIVGYCGAWIHDVIEERKNDRWTTDK